MDSLEKKTLEVSRGFTYSYYTSPARNSLPTIILCHGWPDTAELWEGIITGYLKPAGYGIIAPDLLGYGGTSKPTDYQAYNFQQMSKDAIDILDHEGIDKVIALGHDWGSGSAQRLYNFHADRVLGLVMLNVSYLAPSPDPFDLDQTIALTTQMFGYGTFVSDPCHVTMEFGTNQVAKWYWKVFSSDEGYKLMDAHVESLFTAIHGEPQTLLETLCKQDGIKNYLEQDRRQPVESYATEEMRKNWVARLEKDSFQAPQNWYRSMVNGEQDIANQAVPEQNIVVKVPTLFFGGTQDKVCRPELLGPSQEAGLLPHLKIVTVNAGHWSMLAKPKEFGKALTDWLKENF